MASGEEGGDARSIAGLLRDKFGAKGGGSNQMVQGSLSGASRDELMDCCNNL